MKNLYFLILLLFKPIKVFAHVNDWHMDRWGHMGGYGFGGIFMWIILLVIIVFVVYFIIHATKTRIPDKETPLEVLKKRYARGEMTKDEFQRIKKDLEA